MTKHVFGPVIFGLIGTASGVAAMVWRYMPEYDRVDIGDSVPLAVGGLLLGAGVGLAIMPLYERSPKSRRWIEGAGIILLLGSSFAICGWIAADHVKEARTAGHPARCKLGFGVRNHLLGMADFLGRTPSSGLRLFWRLRGSRDAVIRLLSSNRTCGRHLVGPTEPLPVRATGARSLTAPPRNIYVNSKTLPTLWDRGLIPIGNPALLINVVRRGTHRFPN